MIAFSVIVTTIGRPTLKNTLNSLASLRPWIDEVILMVDGDGVELRNKISNLVTFSSLPFAPRVFYHPVPDACWGHGLRNEAMWHEARGTHLTFMDDDDCYTPEAFSIMQRALLLDPNSLHVFAMRMPDGKLIPSDPELRCGNIGTPCGVVPSIQTIKKFALGFPKDFDPFDYLGKWGRRYEGDFDFYQSCKAKPIYWHLDQVIAEIRPHEVKHEKV